MEDNIITKEKKLKVLHEILRQKLASLRHMRKEQFGGNSRIFLEENEYIIKACMKDIEGEII